MRGPVIECQRYGFCARMLERFEEREGVEIIDRGCRAFQTELRDVLGLQVRHRGRDRCAQIGVKRKAAVTLPCLVGIEVFVRYAAIPEGFPVKADQVSLVGTSNFRIEREHHEVCQVSDALMALQHLPVEETGLPVQEVQVAEVRVAVNQRKRAVRPVVLERFALLVDLAGATPY